MATEDAEMKPVEEVEEEVEELDHEKIKIVSVSRLCASPAAY